MRGPSLRTGRNHCKPIQRTRRKTLPGYRIACGTNDRLFCFIVARVLCATGRHLLCAQICVPGALSGSEGEDVGSGDDEKISPPKRKDSGHPGGSRKSGGKSGENRDVGDTLRRVYHEAIEEQIPDEMLDLLSKLG